MNNSRSTRGFSSKATEENARVIGTRTRKIQSKFFRRADNRVTKMASLPLDGRWLEEAGFLIGEMVTLTVSKDKIIISKT